VVLQCRALIEIIHLTLKNNWVFEDFPNFVCGKLQREKDFRNNGVDKHHRRPQ